jgi:hypothetical protein
VFLDAKRAATVEAVNLSFNTLMNAVAFPGQFPKKAPPKDL